jgi:hypothetical protein
MLVIFIRSSRMKDYYTNTNEAGKVGSHLETGCSSRRQVTWCLTQELTQILTE